MCCTNAKHKNNIQLLTSVLERFLGSKILWGLGVNCVSFAVLCTCVWSSARGCDGGLGCGSGIGCDASSSSPWSVSASGACLVMRSVSASFCGHENGT